MVDHPQKLAPCRRVLDNCNVFVTLKYSRGDERDEAKTRI